jgi:hypothetical protein
MDMTTDIAAGAATIQTVNPALVSLRDVYKSFGQVEVISGVSLDIAQALSGRRVRENQR